MLMSDVFLTALTISTEIIYTESNMVNGQRDIRERNVATRWHLSFHYDKCRDCISRENEPFANVKNERIDIIKCLSQTFYFALRIVNSFHDRGHSIVHDHLNVTPNILLLNNF